MDAQKDLSPTQIEILQDEKGSKPLVGTVRLIEDGGIVLVPTPTNDPNGIHITAPSSRQG